MTNYLMEFKYMEKIKELKSITKDDLDKQEQGLIKDKIYSEEDAKYRSELIRQIEYARIQREMPRRFWDDMTFTQYYIANQNAANTYLQKKKNKNETRVNTGTTEKKIETVLNELLALNVKSKIYAFDQKDKMDYDFSRCATNLVRRTNELENSEEFWIDYIKELLTQPAVFVWEHFDERIVFDKRKTDKLGNQVRKYKKFEFKKEVFNALQVYLGDITIPARKFQTQPYIVLHEIVNKSEAFQRFGDNPNWQYVKPGTQNATTLFDYRIHDGTQTGGTDDESIEIIHYLNSPKDEYNCLVNGVMMFSAKTKLPYEKEGYNIEMSILKPFATDFAYGKSLVSSAKYLQSIDNETIRLFIRKFRQVTDPPIGINRGRLISKDLFEPSTTHVGVRADSFDKLIDHQGISSGDVAFQNIMKEAIKEFLGTSDTMSGQIEKGNTTATEIMNLRRQGMKMLGLSIKAVKIATQKSDMLRLYDILENGTKPLGKAVNKLTGKLENVFNTYNLEDAELPDGSTGRYGVEFTDKPLDIDEGMEDSRQSYLDMMENKAKGTPGFTVKVNVDMLRKMPFFFYAVAAPEPEQNDELNKALFGEQQNQIAGIQKMTGRKPKSDKMIERFERTWGIEDTFMDEGQEMMDAEQDPRLAEIDKQIAEMDSNPDNLPNSMLRGVKQETTQPSLNNLLKQQ